MSQRYKGAILSATPPTTTTTSAPGEWTLQQQMQAQAAGQWPFGGPFIYIEDVFSTYLYTGNGSTQTITNGINLSTNGGLVWSKARNDTGSHIFVDTNRGATKVIFSDTTNAEVTVTDSVTGFTSTGYTIGAYGNINYSSSYRYVSWTFRKQPKFFDVVTYTGNGANRTIAHNLGSVPGCIIVREYSSGGDWIVYHRSLGNTDYVRLNTTGATAALSTVWNNTTPTSTEFTVGTSNAVNANGASFVAYLFAHDAGGFGLTGTDNVISCGSFTTDSTGLATVTLGYEPQWILYKKSATTSDWTILDTMRGMAITASNILAANTSAAEVATVNLLTPTATGFVAPSAGFSSNTSYIYIAIRRGPMKTPTSGTSVFAIDTSTSSTAPRWESGWPVDAVFQKRYSGGTNDWQLAPRITQNYSLIPNLTDTENYSTVYAFDYQNGCFTGASLSGYIAYMLRRAPSFMDVVCYTGNGASSRSITHNLTVAPEIIIVKSRNLASTSWDVWHTANGVPSVMYLNSTSAKSTLSGHFDTLPTASVFYVGGSAFVNESGYTYVAYLFASCPGVSKVGSYSGTGGTQTISCGFAARFVMIKRTDSTGDWWVWDTARGMVAGTDPRLAFNLTDAESNANWVYTDASGFQIVATDATVNASGGTYIYLAIA